MNKVAEGIGNAIGVLLILFIAMAIYAIPLIIATVVVILVIKILW